ncbi:MAG: sulfatase-like hydrolase/transferase, partial [Planctomycetota bacterium]
MQASLLTGRWPQEPGVYFNVGADHIDPATALPRLLSGAGYQTVGEGKFWEFEARAMGFSNYTIRNYETFVRLDQDHLFDWLDARDPERPFFVWWAPELPHVPHDPPARLLAKIALEDVPVPAWFQGDEAARVEFRARERVLLAMDAWLDEGLAALLTKLDALGERENTLVVFLIDNGWANGCVSKGWAFEKGLRTPVVFSWPRGIKKVQRSEALVSPVDVYATLLELAGVELPAWNRGTSLAPALRGETPVTRDTLFGALWPLEPTELPADAARDAQALWARSARWKYVLTLRDVDARADAGSAQGEREDVKVSLAPDFHRRRGEVELYDLVADPHEQQNLAARPEHAELLAQLRRDTLAWWTANGGAPIELP